MAYRCCVAPIVVCSRMHSHWEHSAKINIKYRVLEWITWMLLMCMKNKRFTSLSFELNEREFGVVRHHHRMHHTLVRCMNMMIIIISYYNMLKFINNNDVIKCICLHTLTLMLAFGLSCAQTNPMSAKRSFQWVPSACAYFIQFGRVQL